jgi:hypothetical protein
VALNVLTGIGKICVFHFFILLLIGTIVREQVKDTHHHLNASACSSANLANDIGFFPVTVSTSLDILDK